MIFGFAQNWSIWADFACFLQAVRFVQLPKRSVTRAIAHFSKFGRKLRFCDWKFELNHKKFDLEKSVKSLQTKGGINEELLKRLTKDKFFTKLQNNLNKIYLRLKKANDK